MLSVYRYILKHLLWRESLGRAQPVFMYSYKVIKYSLSVSCGSLHVNERKTHRRIPVRFSSYIRIRHSPIQAVY